MHENRRTRGDALHALRLAQRAAGWIRRPLGRPDLQQLRTRCGIWFWDARAKTNLPRTLNGRHSPSGLPAELNAHRGIADANLHHTPNDLPGLRPYQRAAIAKVEERLALGQRDLLLAMATGTGKTRACVSLLYRLIRARRFRRILFLVDRTELGLQASDAFGTIRLENLRASPRSTTARRSATPDPMRRPASTSRPCKAWSGGSSSLPTPRNRSPSIPTIASSSTSVTAATSSTASWPTTKSASSTSRTTSRNIAASSITSTPCASASPRPHERDEIVPRLTAAFAKLDAAATAHTAAVTALDRLDQFLLARAFSGQLN